MADLTGHDWTGFTNGDMTVSASSYYAGYDTWKIFDGLSNCWMTNASTTGWLKLDLGLGNQETVVRVGIQAGTTPNRALKDFTIQGSNNDVDWTTLETVTGETAWSSGERRDFVLTTTGAYRYYKIDITANNGDGSFIQAAEVFVYSAGGDIRSSQNIAQVEWQEPGNIKAFQVLAQVEWAEVAAGWTGKVNGATNPAKINGIAVANISKVMGIS